MDVTPYINKYETYIVVIVILAIIVIIIFIVISIISWKNGNNIKIFGFEINNNKTKSTMNENELSKMFINAKNVNTGTNYGSIGDVYNGIKQRHLTDADKANLLGELNEFIRKYDSKINKSHITIGCPGDKESSVFANEVAHFIYEQGYRKIEKTVLMTFGVVGKKFGVSNAPDDTIMIEIFPSDNV